MTNPNNNKNFNEEALRINRALKKKLDISFTIDEIKEAKEDLANHGFLSGSSLVEELEQRLKPYKEILSWDVEHVTNS